MYFSVNNYPELEIFSAKEKKEEIEIFLKECPKAKAYSMYPVIIIVSASLPFIRTINDALFGHSSVMLSAMTGGVLGGLGALLVMPIFASGPIRKLFVEYWKERGQQTDTFE